MDIKRKEESYTVSFIRKKDVQQTVLVGVKDQKDVVRMLWKVFEGRFDKPEALTPRDGVRISVRRNDPFGRKSMRVYERRIYNKSVRQARIMFEKAIQDINHKY